MRSQIGKNIQKATKNNLKFRLKCRDLKIKFLETKAELFINTIGFCTSVYKLLDHFKTYKVCFRAAFSYSWDMQYISKQ